MAKLNSYGMKFLNKNLGERKKIFSTHLQPPQLNKATDLLMKFSQYFTSL